MSRVNLYMILSIYLIQMLCIWDYVECNIFVGTHGDNCEMQVYINELMSDIYYDIGEHTQYVFFDDRSTDGG